MKGNFHVQFGIGGGESDLSADHTKTNGWRELRIISGIFALVGVDEKADYQR
jgi:hypothetical protein